MYDFKKIEEEAREYWKKINLLNKLIKRNKNNEKYFLLDGPPYANDIPHVGHVRNTVYKDFNIRLAFLKGYQVLFQPGFDTHGLPIENKVEKKLNLKSKKDIEKLGIKKFTELCKASATDNKDLWMDVYDKLGSWYSWKEPYLTYNNSYLESAWWTFKQIWDKGYVYEGKKPVFWCPSCETALAGYEVTDSYAMKKDPYILIKFKVKNTKNDFLLVFTTTPWTLISNVAIAAKADENYTKVETSQGNLILAKERLEVLTEAGIGYKILEEFKGKKLDGIEYEHIIDVPEQKELEKNPRAHKVYMSVPILKERVSAKMRTKKETKGEDVFEDFVTVKEGTGLVHTAPGHGKTDNEVGKHYGLPEPSPLDDSCKYTDAAGQFSGMFVKDADKDILEVLEKTGKLLFSSTVSHKYPLCWRCKSPLIFRLSNQWFIKIDPVKQKMLDGNKKVDWYPEFARERFEAWVLNADDWNVSRQRYWGIPMPIWKCICGEIKVIGSLKELEKNSTKKLSSNFDLHIASEVKLKCDKCKEEMKRINDIFDVWFDSGVAPWASLGYPFEGKKLFEEHYPVSRINESQDQIRGWFYSLMFCGVAAHDKIPYKEVSMPGWVVDDKGEKMSKSVGNVVYAKDAIEEVGADNLRFYYMWDIAPYSLQLFNKDAIKKEVWKVFNVLVNLNTYLTNLTDKIKKVSIKEIEDKWLLSKLNTLIKEYSENLDKFEYHTATRKLSEFILNNLSREYIHMIRERADNKDEAVAYVIFESLSKVLSLLAPITPHLSENEYQKLKEKYALKDESVHLLGWPKEDKKSINSELEQNFEIIKDIITKILSEREKIKLGVRWPLSSVEVNCDSKTEKAVKTLSKIIEVQTNIRRLKTKEAKELSIILDSKLTPELEREGYAREIARKIQALRKNAGLNKSDEINLSINSEYSLAELESYIKNKVGAAKLIFEKSEYKNKFKEKIKDNTFEIASDKL